MELDKCEALASCIHESNQHSTPKAVGGVSAAIVPPGLPPPPAHAAALDRAANALLEWRKEVPPGPCFGGSAGGLGSAEGGFLLLLPLPWVPLSMVCRMSLESIYGRALLMHV